jgi:hypothetical protein
MEERGCGEAEGQSVSGWTTRRGRTKYTVSRGGATSALLKSMTCLLLGAGRNKTNKFVAL